ncbi:hypothetical protein ALGA_1599 [Labilibaculum antarcticum]|uniref:Mannosylglycerate hydrolase MGH1-like glycoside hydrolase domain-containing protein n=2 Tax=Labilibaculum antarcticum TaxID=1717717 RepID=A0A1Y1CI24_9BACT|nr:hypothetical protein ALGA_1599 [Labilibaculum antarcticum]
MQCKSVNDNSKLESHSIAPTVSVNKSNTHNIAKAYRIALGDIFGNIQLHKSGMLQEEKSCLYAGLSYQKPWTRDAAINIWNGFGLLFPSEAKNTLLAQIDKNNEGKFVIIGQYWDKVIWSIGAWNYYLYTGDKEFLDLSYRATVNTIKDLEQEEFSPELNLFRGAAVYGDGVSAYPKIYTKDQNKTENESYSGIYEWPNRNPDLKVKIGFGLPMHALSTNCVYYKVYNVLHDMEKELTDKMDAQWEEKAEKLKESINKNFWDKDRNTYRYLVDPFGNCESQEGLGLSYAVLFGVANAEQAKSIFENTHIEPSGIPCLYPSFKRYVNKNLDSYGRHSGTVWPHVQGFWADAAMKYNQEEIFLSEFKNLTEHALRDKQFVEIYHPKTGMAYGGIQEPIHKNWEEWFCADRQSWSATAYIRMLLLDIIGMEFSKDGIGFKPYMSEDINDFRLINLKYRNVTLNIILKGTGSNIVSCKINGKEGKPFIQSSLFGVQQIEIELSDK